MKRQKLGNWNLTENKKKQKLYKEIREERQKYFTQSEDRNKYGWSITIVNS